MIKIDKSLARSIIESVGANGLPPEAGFQHFSVGLEPYLNCIDADYLATFIQDGGSAFKLVKGAYGGGKTHFLYSIRALAWKHNFAVAYVVLSPESTPFHKLEKVYASIANAITPPLSSDELSSGCEKGIGALLQRYYMTLRSECLGAVVSEPNLKEAVAARIELLRETESISFSKAIKNALLALNNKSESRFSEICQWLNGEGYIRKVHSEYGILEKIDKSTAFRMIRSLSQMLRSMHYSGLVILFDEAEQKSSMSTKQRGVLQSNLREIIDACGHTDFQGTMVFYAVPDLTFLEGTTQIYEALKQRLTTVYADMNPTGVQIDLEKSVEDPKAFLVEIGQRLSEVYETAYSCELLKKELAETIKQVAVRAADMRFDVGYKRLFVKSVVKALHYLRVKGQAPSVQEVFSADLK